MLSPVEFPKVAAGGAPCRQGALRQPFQKHAGEHRHVFQRAYRARPRPWRLEVGAHWLPHIWGCSHEECVLHLSTKLLHASIAMVELNYRLTVLFN